MAIAFCWLIATATAVRERLLRGQQRREEEAIANAGDNLKDLRHTYTDPQSAVRAARAEWSRLQRGAATLTATLSYTLARGRIDLIPELTYSLTGIEAEIADIIWLGANVQHSFTPDAYTTVLELESKLPDVAELAEEGSYTGIVAWYRDEKTGKQQKLTEGDQTSPRRLVHHYQSKASAERAVKREWERLQA